MDRLLGNKKKGFFVDIGAYDPYYISNTMRFYRRGWRGINVEPNRESWKRFVTFRPRDINLNVGIGVKKGSLLYYSIDPPTLSTFQEDQAEGYIKRGFTLLEKTKVPVVPLKNILKKYVNKVIVDFISIDVEGMEMDVLKSNDWRAFRPKYICIESCDYSNTKKGRDNYERIGEFLKKVGYGCVFNNKLNSFYKDIRNKNHE